MSNVAKNMDSVFDNCTKDELEFDVFFDEDDSLIDLVAGVNEMGVNITGENFDFATLIDENGDLVDGEGDDAGEHPDDDYQKEGPSYSEKDAEGSKEVKPEIGGEVGDGKEVSGKENSAESQADDTKDEEEAIGANDKQQVSLEDTNASTLEESEDPIADDISDAEAREGEADKVEDTEGASTEVVGDALDGKSDKEDPIADDISDAEARDGKADKIEDTEGVDAEVPGAAMESVEALDEAARWAFLPKLTQDSKLKKLYDACKDAKDVASVEGEKVDKSTLLEVLKAALRILDVILNIKDFFALPVCITIIGIPFYMIQRCLSWAVRLGEDAVTKEYTRKCIVTLKKILESCDDEAKKAKIQKQIDDLEKQLKDFDKDVKESVDSEYEDAVAALEAAINEADDEGPLRDDDPAERAGEDVPDGSVATESKDATKANDECGDNCGPTTAEDECGDNCKDVKEAKEADKCPDCGKAANECTCGVKESSLDTMAESIIGSILGGSDIDSVLSECDDAEARDGKADKVEDTEGHDTEVVGAALDGKSDKEDPIADDISDAEARDGKADKIEDTEGVDAEVPGAAMESTESEYEDAVAALESVLKESDEEEVEGDPGDESDAEVEESAAPEVSDPGKKDVVTAESVSDMIDNYMLDVALESAISEIEAVAEGLTCEVAKDNNYSEIKIDSTEEVVPDDVKKDDTCNNVSESFEPEDDAIVYSGWLNNLTEASKDKEEEELVEDDESTDDEDIEAVAKMTDDDSVGDLDYDYDDDELIDMAINDKDFDS